jgi:hypothetical protein
MKYLFLSSSLILYCMVLWAFAIRELMPAGYHYFYPITFIFLFIIQIFVAYKLMDQIRFVKSFQPLSILLFISLNIYVLNSISSIKRESEIRNYFAKNELSLANIVDHFDSYGDDNRTQEMKDAMNLERVRLSTEMFSHDDKQISRMINLRMYTCVGYAYGVLYTCDEEIERPKNLGGSPVTKWLKLKDHWFYYSIFD